MLGIFLDTETNGLNPHKHKLVEVAYKIIDVSSGQLLETFETVISQSKETWGKSDPESLKVNGFSWEEVQKGIHPEAAAAVIKSTFAQFAIKRGSAVFICQNPSFDRAFFSQLVDPDLQEALSWPYHWLELASMYWAEAIRSGKADPKRFPWVTGFSKDKIATACSLPSESKPHRAMNGVNHLLLCYKAIIGFPGEKHTVDSGRRGGLWTEKWT